MKIKEILGSGGGGKVWQAPFQGCGDLKQKGPPWGLLIFSGTTHYAHSLLHVTQIVGEAVQWCMCSTCFSSFWVVFLFWQEISCSLCWKTAVRATLMQHSAERSVCITVQYITVCLALASLSISTSLPSLPWCLMISLYDP